MKISRLAALPLAAMILLGSSALTPSFALDSSTLPTISFATQTGLSATTSDIQNTWNSLVSMGTTQYVGGVIGNFKIDESSLVAAAMSIGVTELDNFLKTGVLSSSSSDAGSVLSSVMSSASGIDISSIVGSYTSGGGSLTSASLLSTSGATSSGGQCDPTIATELATQGQQKVNDIVNVGMSSEYGFSQMSQMTGSGSSGSFASLGCLDKLFQNAGADILFKPPTMGMLTNMLQNWTCPKVPGVAEQIAGAFGSGDRFATGSLGGFFPLSTFGESNDGSSTAAGLGASISDLYGEKFASTSTISSSDVSKMTDLKTLFK